jgi:hypothetical protein
VDATVTVTAAAMVATVIVTASVVAAVAATGVAAVAGSNPAHHYPAIDGAVMAVITDAAVFRINGVSAVVHVTAAATAGFGDGGGEDTKTKNGGDKHAELFHDGGMRMVFDWGPVGDWRGDTSHSVPVAWTGVQRAYSLSRRIFFRRNSGT